MAKRETNTRRQAKAKRETNAQRRERERKRRAIDEIAHWIVWRINRKKVSSAEQIALDQQPKHIYAAMTGAALIESESIENIADGLRLAADMLEGKPRDGRAFGAHNRQILTALLDAGARAVRDHPSRARTIYETVATGNSLLGRLGGHHDETLSKNKDSTYRVEIRWALPTFSEFLSVYREQNPRAKVEDRTLRRTLERLQLPTLPDKRGRPKGK